MRIGKLLIATTALSAAMMCGAAHAAGYQVTATSNAYAGNIYSGGRGHCTYGLTVSGGECTQGTATYGGASSAGITPLGGAGNARSVTAMTMGSGAGASATSRTNADLATASLHLYGADSGQTYNISSQSTPFGGTLEAGTLRDTLHFTVLGASPTTVTRITAIFTLDGRMYPVGGNVDMPNSASGEIYGDLHFGTLPSRFDLKNNLSTGFVTTVGYLDNYPSGHANTWTTNTDHTINTSTFTYDLVGAASDIAFDLNAHLQCSSGFVCDYNNTAKFGLLLPPNVSFTSDSGVFLAGAAGGVPEPASWALMISGMSLIGVALRGRRRALTCGANVA